MAGTVSREVAAALDQTALGRARVFLPIVVLGMAIALAVSEPVGIPLPHNAIVLNLTLIGVAIACYVALRRDRIPPRWSHALGAFVWLLAPITTVTSTALTGTPALAMPLMIEIATTSLQVDTRWAVTSTAPIVAIGIWLSIDAGSPPIYPLGIIGVWIVAMIMQIGLRRSMINGEARRLEVVRTAEALTLELEERRRAEADREKLREQFVHAQRMDAVGTLAAGLAHDMNNILGGILAYGQLLRRAATDPAVREDLDRICQEAERGASLTHSLLAFSRRGQYHRRPITVSSIFDGMRPLFSRTLGKGVTVEYSEIPDVTIDGDPAQLGQVLLNLCLNGADAMSGNGVLTIAVTLQDVAANQINNLAPGRYARLSVTDTGTGMDEATRNHIFEPFFTTKPVGKGTGLGLAMVYGAVQAHGGDVDVVTAPNAGTTMHVYLPVGTSIVETPRISDSYPVHLRGLVLVVDDEPVLRAATTRIVESHGLTTLTAVDGVEALATFREHRDEIALVLLDMAMPNMNGATCFKELRKLAPVPVLLVSGYVNDAAARETLAAGAEGFLEKPFTREQLVVEIDRILGRTAPDITSP